MDSDFMNNLANAMKNGNIPDDIKNMISNMKDNNYNANNANNNSNNYNDNSNNATNSINPDMLKNIMNMFNNSSNSSNSNNFGDSTNTDNNNTSIPNFDINMLLKMKSIMDKMNSNKNDPRSNLLLSLKPYLKESRKNKVEQYVQLFNMTKVIDAFHQDSGGENTK